MEHLEVSIFPLTTQGDLVKNELRGQGGQRFPHSVGPCGKLWLGQLPRKCQVKAEFFHHIGIAPLHEQGILPRCEAGCATARQLCVAGRCAKIVKRADAGRCHPLQGFCVTLRCKGQKPAKRGQRQTIADGRRKRRRQFRDRLFKISDSTAILEPEGRLQRAMKPVFARCHCNVTQIGQIGLTCQLTVHNIPPEPRRPEIGQRPCRRNVINCKSRV